jgi:hypothetical protein
MTVQYDEAYVQSEVEHARRRARALIGMVKNVQAHLGDIVEMMETTVENMETDLKLK